MSLVRAYLGELRREAVAGWNRFWFTPADPATLALIRILAGAMLLYTHLVWTLGLVDFFGPDSWVSAEAAAFAHGRADETSFVWSYFWLLRSPAALWTAHIAALAVFALLTLGLFSRVTSVLAYVNAVSYVNRVPGALFGLDQINCMLAMYLMIGPSGAAWSLDRLLAARKAGRRLPPAEPSTSANLAIRLIQLQMCVIYFFAGLGKLHGETWWSGEALWYSLANLEYQSLDMTWLAAWPLTMAVITQVTVYWELSFCVLVWPRLLRPLVLTLAVPLHLGIAFCMGMVTFGLVMLIGCLAFVPPWLLRRVLSGKTTAGGAQELNVKGAETVVAARRTRRSPMAAARREHT
jgi:hypothetical protein